MSGDKAGLLRSLQLKSVDGDERPREWRIWSVAAVAGVLGAMVAVLAMLWLSSPPTPAAPRPAPAARTADRATSPRAGTLVASGYVVARRHATVAAEITGRLVEVRVEEGQAVVRGQILAVLDMGLSAADLAAMSSRRTAAAATVALQSVELAEAERILARIRILQARGYATNAELTRTQSRVASLRAQLSQARANLASSAAEQSRANLQVDKHTIRAPFSGVVISKNAQAGEIISPISAGGGFTRTGICTLVDMSSLEIEVDVNEQHIGKVRPGQAVEAVLNAYTDRVYAGRVIATVPTADRNRSTVKVRVAFNKLDPNVLPDMAVRVSFFQ